MNLVQTMNSEGFEWVVIPTLIFISRIMDVSIGTMRIIFVSRGKKALAPLLGFIEILIWIVAISQIMQHLNNVACYIAYAAGFAMGNFVGMLLEEKLALGMLVIRVIVVKDEYQLKERLKNAGFGVTYVDGYGAKGKVELIYTVIKRKDLNRVMEIVHQYDSKAFYSIEDARQVGRGIFPERSDPTISKMHLLRKKQ